MAQGRQRADLDSDRLLELALLHLITMLGEAANRVHKEAQAQYPEVAWPMIVGMRNRLIHGYDEIDFDILWQTVVEDLPPLIAVLEKVVPPQEN